CYRENPHIDARDSAVRAAELLARCLNEGTVPRMVSLVFYLLRPDRGARRRWLRRRGLWQR
ncbi:M81 family metallopeptidase, partial [Haliea sp.]|uniref:M81 family metallopeptidase n=1 Tax=Haliea sp. TaxID=1932666 RepID=UPI0032EB7084